MADPSAAFSRGDVMREIRDLKDRVKTLETARTLESASIGRGGLRVQGGRILAEDQSGERVFEVTTEPPDIFMRPELFATVARSVIGESVFFDSVASASIRTAFDTFGDLETLIGSNPSPGPEVSFTLTGSKFLAIWGAPTNAMINSATVTRSEGYMGVEVSGEASISPAVGQSNQITFSYPSVSGSLSTTGAFTVAFMFEDLSPGSYTVTAKYRIDDQGTSALTNVTWQDRWLLVIAF